MDAIEEPRGLNESLHNPRGKCWGHGATLEEFTGFASVALLPALIAPVVNTRGARIRTSSVASTPAAVQSRHKHAGTPPITLCGENDKMATVGLHPRWR